MNLYWCNAALYVICCFLSLFYMERENKLVFSTVLVFTSYWKGSPFLLCPTFHWRSTYIFYMENIKYLFVSKESYFISRISEWQWCSFGMCSKGSSPGLTTLISEIGLLTVNPLACRATLISEIAYILQMLGYNWFNVKATQILKTIHQTTNQ